MNDPLTQRRYLLPFRASRIPQQFTDVLVIGGGVAGLRAAIGASESVNVLLLTKDTKIGGAGLCDDQAVRITIEEGPRRVLELLSWGAQFDKTIVNPYDPAF